MNSPAVQLGLRWSVLAAGCLVSTGCMDPPRSSGPKKPPTTDKIGEFDPNADGEVVTPTANVTNPITGPLEILKLEQVKLPLLAIQHALNLYNAAEGHYPESHDEFMTQIIKANNIRLPVLPSGQEYQYDLANHTLLIVKQEDAKTAPPDGTPGRP